MAVGGGVLAVALGTAKQSGQQRQQQQQWHLRRGCSGRCMLSRTVHTAAARHGGLVGFKLFSLSGGWAECVGDWIAARLSQAYAPVGWWGWFARVG